MRLTDFTHELWKSLILPGSFVIDATCGAGHDTLFLAGLALTSTSGRLIALDIQEEALKKTEEKIAHLPTKERIEIHSLCHSHIDQFESPDFIAYNLGYLPRGDKTITTTSETTLESLKKALKILSLGGSISIMIYPGHPAGAKESVDLLDWSQKLSSKTFTVHLYRLWNIENAPQTLLIQKIFLK